MIETKKNKVDSGSLKAFALIWTYYLLKKGFIISNSFLQKCLFHKNIIRKQNRINYIQYYLVKSRIDSLIILFQTKSVVCVCMIIPDSPIKINLKKKLIKNSAILISQRIKHFRLNMEGWLEVKRGWIWS